MITVIVPSNTPASVAENSSHSTHATSQVRHTEAALDHNWITRAKVARRRPTSGHVIWLGAC
jgi:hypothetical protein